MWHCLDFVVLGRLTVCHFPDFVAMGRLTRCHCLDFVAMGRLRCDAALISKSLISSFYSDLISLLDGICYGKTSSSKCCS